MTESSLRELSLQLVFVTLSWSTTIALSFLELAEEDWFGHAYVFHRCDVANPAQLHWSGHVSRMEDIVYACLKQSSSASTKKKSIIVVLLGSFRKIS